MRLVEVQKMLTPKEIASILGISYPKALDFIRFSGIDYIKIGNQYRVAEDKLEAFLAQKGKVTVYIN